MLALSPSSLRSEVIKYWRPPLLALGQPERHAQRTEHVIYSASTVDQCVSRRAASAMSASCGIGVGRGVDQHTSHVGSESRLCPVLRVLLYIV